MKILTPEQLYPDDYERVGQKRLGDRSSSNLHHVYDIKPSVFIPFSERKTVLSNFDSRQLR
jgi:hypothetical protein